MIRKIRAVGSALGWGSFVQLLLFLAMMVYAAGGWKTAREQADSEAAQEVQALRQELRIYAEQNQRWHETMAAEFVRRSEIDRITKQLDRIQEQLDNATFKR